MEKYTFEATAAIENMEAVMAFIEERTASIDNPRIARNLAMVVEELSLNVFNYAYDGVRGKFSLSIAIDRERRRVVMEFCDVGKPFNPLLQQAPDLDLPLSEREIGGLGIVLSRKLTDEQSYVREDGKNILTVVKYY